MYVSRLDPKGCATPATHRRRMRVTSKRRFTYHLLPRKRPQRHKEEEAGARQTQAPNVSPVAPETRVRKKNDNEQEQCTLNQALIQDRRNPQLSLLAASQTKDKEALTKEGVTRVIRELQKSFEYVVCDSPAGIESGECALLYVCVWGCVRCATPSLFFSCFFCFAFLFAPCVYMCVHSGRLRLHGFVGCSRLLLG